MNMRPWLACVLAAWCGRSPARAAGTMAGEPLRLQARESVVFLGDSITEQHLWTAMVETFLLTRLPARDLTFTNAGWGGDTARGGRARWDRDVAPHRPTLVLAAFGMNDGAYSDFDQWILDGWLPPERALVERARADGARMLLLGPSCADPRPSSGWTMKYNDTLERMTAALVAAGAEAGAPVVDVFHPTRAALTRAKAADPKGGFLPDAIHPTPPGHLVMAHAVLRALDLPPAPGELVIRAGPAAPVERQDAALRAMMGLMGFTLLVPQAVPPPLAALPRPATAVALAAAFTGDRDGMTFTWSPPCLPWWVPPQARAALAWIPFEDDLNRFRLVIRDWPVDAPCHVSADGRPVARWSAAEAGAGIDLALLDAAPWARRGRALWELSQAKWRLHRQAWREAGLEAPEAGRDPARDAAWRDAQAGRIRAMAGRMQALARPEGWVIRLSVAPVFGTGSGRTRLLEGWESPDLDPGFPWDESVRAAVTDERKTEGRYGARLDVDLAAYAWPTLSGSFAYPQDLSGCPRFALDVYLPPDAARRTARPAIGLAWKSGKRSAAARSARPLKAGWTTLVFDPASPDWKVGDGGAAALPADLRAAVDGWELSVGGDPAVGRTWVVFDNLRAVE